MICYDVLHHDMLWCTTLWHAVTCSTITCCGVHPDMLWHTLPLRVMMMYSIWHVVIYSTITWVDAVMCSIMRASLMFFEDKAKALSRWMYPGAIRSLYAPCPGASGDRCPWCQDICFLWATLGQDLLSHLSQADKATTLSQQAHSQECHQYFVKLQSESSG